MARVTDFPVIKTIQRLTYPPESVGRQMTSKVPLVRGSQTAREILEHLTLHARDYDTVNYIYVATPKDRIKGVISIKELLGSPDESKAGELMQTDLVTVRPEVDQERAANLALKHNIKALPVTDKQGKIVGVLSSDTISEILYKEAEEDSLHFAGIIPTQALFSSTIQQFRSRIPWILFGLMGGLITASVIESFSGTLRDHLILAGFIPLVAYLSNAVGNQTQIIFIRDLATDRGLKLSAYVRTQFALAALIGLTCWLLLYVLGVIFWNSSLIGFVVGPAVFTTILMATVFSISIPLGLRQLRIDPAIGSGPFTAIMHDLFSVLIYLQISSWLLT
jgi:magnesium transporter